MKSRFTKQMNLILSLSFPPEGMTADDISFELYGKDDYNSSVRRRCEALVRAGRMKYEYSVVDTSHLRIKSRQIKLYMPC